MSPYTPPGYMSPYTPPGYVHTLPPWVYTVLPCYTAYYRPPAPCPATKPWAQLGRNLWVGGLCAPQDLKSMRREGVSARRTFRFPRDKERKDWIANGSSLPYYLGVSNVAQSGDIPGPPPCSSENGNKTPEESDGAAHIGDLTGF